MLCKTVKFTIFDYRNYLTPLSEVESTRPIYLINLEYFLFFQLEMSNILEKGENITRKVMILLSMYLMAFYVTLL